MNDNDYGTEQSATGCEDDDGVGGDGILEDVEDLGEAGNARGGDSGNVSRLYLIPRQVLSARQTTNYMARAETTMASIIELLGQAMKRNCDAKNGDWAPFQGSQESTRLTKARLGISWCHSKV